MSVVRARGWGWRHTGRREPAVRDLDLRVEAGERILLLGASGSGKSTLLAALAGVLGGDDEDGSALGMLEVLGGPPRAARGRVGLVLQDPDAQMILERVGDDTAFGPENLGVPREEIWRRVATAHRAVGLELPLDRSTAQLSGGQKQRLALAGVLAMEPELLLLDEPTANLDPPGARAVRDSVGEALEGDRTAIIVEHRVDLWWDLVTRVVVLAAGGGTLADGAPDAVLARHADQLAAAGVWLPHRAPADTRSARESGRPLLTASALEIAPAGADVVRSGIDLALAEGEVLAVTGPNGSGKSTLALALGGLQPPAAGELRAEPALAAGAGPSPIRWRSRDLLTRIGSVFQNPEHQFLRPTVRDELAVGLRALRIPDAELRIRVDRLLDRLDLDDLADANPFTLSGGQQRRLSVATALATAPRILVLDEPTFGQDARGWAALVELLGGLADEGSALVVVTHDERIPAALGARELALEAVAS